MRCVLVAFCLLAAAQSLRIAPPGKPHPDFKVCETEESCGSSNSSNSSVPWLFMGRLLESGYARARAVTATGRRSAVLHVGADGLVNSGRWTDVDLYSVVLSKMGVAPGALKLVFVEPLASKSTRFWKNVQRLPVNASQVNLVTAMVSGDCRGQPIVYKVSDIAGRDFGFNAGMMDGWATSEPGRIRMVMSTWLEKGIKVHCKHGPGDCSEGMRRLYNAHNFSSYVEALQVPCFTLAELMKEAGTAPEDVAMLTVDAEGLDASIVEPSLDIPGFRPGFIMYEGPEYGTGTVLAEKLRQRGYSVGFKGGDVAGGGDGHDIIVAVLPMP